MELTGIITRINYYNPDNGYSVIIVTLEKDNLKILQTKSHLINNKLVVVGTLDRKPILDEEYTFEGDFVRDQNYGLQFKFESFKRHSLNSVDSIIQYLSSDLFYGIGLVTAKNIVSNFGTEALDIIRKNPEALKAIGIKGAAIKVLHDTITENYNSQELVMFFINYGITMSMCHKIVAALGPNAIQIVKENPYILMDKIERFGFIKNDAFALKLGIKKDSKERLVAVIHYVLKETIYSTGNSYVLKTDLLNRVNKFLKDTPINDVLFTNTLEILKNEKKVFESNEGLLFDYNLYNKENELASYITDKLRCSSLDYKESDIDEAFEKTIKAINIELSDLQKVAVKAAFTEPLVIITGGPGTGKTTIVKAILNMYVQLHGGNDTVLEGVALLAPTGKASKRLSEVTNFHAQTIHKYLGYMGENYFEFGKDYQKSDKLIIIDEASMMDLPLAYQLFSAIKTDTHVIIVGDVDQLPSVGPGQVLKDLIDSKEITTIRLNKIHRQAADSKIIQLAHNVNEGLIPENFLTKYYDRIFIPSDNDNIMNLIKDWVNLAFNKGKTLNQDIQILAPMYRCKNGINELNTELQNIANPLNGNLELKFLGQNFRVNDKVIQLVNRSDKGIMNGDIGIIQDFLFTNGEINGLIVKFDSGLVNYVNDELEDLKLAYAISIHKSQGSEFDIVILPLSPSYSFMFKRKLIYTAITRAKKMLILIGDANSLQRGIGLIEAQRFTILKELINDNLSSKIHKINDQSSAFNYLGEEETLLSPYDFETKPKKEAKIEKSLGEIEFDLEDI